MNAPASPSTLGDLRPEYRDAVAAMRLGCDRETAARCVGWTSAELAAQLEAEPLFQRELLRAEAIVEIGHLRNVQAAAQEEKNWRASVWWLERRAPGRYARPKAPGVDGPRAAWLKPAQAAVSRLVGNEELRRALRAKLAEIAALG